MKTPRVVLVGLLLVPAASQAVPRRAARRHVLAQRAPSNPSRPAAPARPADPPAQRPDAGGASQAARPGAGTPAAPQANPPAPGAPLDAAGIVARLQAFYDRTTDYEADFTQVSRNQLAGREQRRSGHVRFL